MNDSKAAHSRENPRPCSYFGTGDPGSYNCRCCPENCNPGNGYCCYDCRYQSHMREIRDEEDAHA